MTHKYLAATFLAAALATACAPETPEGDGVAASAGHGGASMGKSGSGGSPAGSGGSVSPGGGSGGSAAGAAGNGEAGTAGTAGMAVGGAGGAGAGVAGASGGGASPVGGAGSSGSASGAGAAGSAGSDVGTEMDPGTLIKLTVVSTDWSNNVPPCMVTPGTADLMFSLTILGKTYMGTSTCYDSVVCDELDIGLVITGIHLADVQKTVVNYTIWNDKRGSGGTIVKCKTGVTGMPNPLIISSNNEYAMTESVIRVRIEKM